METGGRDTPLGERGDGYTPHQCRYYALGAPPHNLDFLQKQTIIYPRPKIVMKQVYMKPTELKISVLSSIFNFQSI